VVGKAILLVPAQELAAPVQELVETILVAPAQELVETILVAPA
jgi:hypothetical protein